MSFNFDIGLLTKSSFLIKLFQVPEPKELSEDDLLKLLESEEPTGYRVPMSLGEPHAELDKSKLK